MDAIRQLNHEFNWGVCLLQEVGTSNVQMPDGEDPPAYYSFGDTAGLFIHRCGTWRRLGVLLSLDVFKPIKAWAAPYASTVLVRSAIVKQCHSLFTSVHLPNLQKPWDVLQSGAERLDAELRCGPPRHEHLAMHLACGDFYVHLTLDDGVYVHERTRRIWHWQFVAEINLMSTGALMTGHVPCLQHTFFPFSSRMSPSTLDYFAVRRFNPRWNLQLAPPQLAERYAVVDRQPW